MTTFKITRASLERHLPILTWAKTYDRDTLTSDGGVFKLWD